MNSFQLIEGGKNLFFRKDIFWINICGIEAGGSMGNNVHLEYYQKNFFKLKELLELLKQEQHGMLLWGAGLKGQGFLEICDPEKKYIQFVVDRDSGKQGKTLPSGHTVKGIEWVDSDMVILVANERYYASVCWSLLDNGFDVKKMKLICPDHFIDGKFTLGDVQSGKIWERKRYYD